MTRLERFYGAATVYDPRRWGTADGYVDFRALPMLLEGMRRQDARERVNALRVHLMAAGTDTGKQLLTEDLGAADGAS